MAQISLEHVEKRFGAKGQVVAVHDLTLTAEDGEFLVLVGPSGCGKTTALRMVAGLETPTAGAIRIGGRIVNDVAPKDRDIAMVFQNYALYPHMSVYDNLAFGLKMRRVPKAEIDRLIRQAAEMLEIGDLLKRKPKELSGGQRQRVALGRAIVRQPQAFLMDEPLSNLDAKLRVQTRAELIKLHRRLGVTTLYVTHDQTEAMTMGSRIAVMNGGVLQQLDTPQRLYDAPVNRFVAGFIGSPSMNFVEGTVARSSEQWTVVVDGVALPLPPRLGEKAAPFQNRPLILGLRPEAITQPRELDGVVLSLPVEVVEPLGSDVYVTFRLGSQSITGRFSPSQPPRPGEAAPVALNLAAAHLFDPTTEAAI
ncbi:MAG: glycerol-3-phosphate ABC transporter ATP-binding protein [Dehalococcoidia bacterium]|nr:MAG: glycerol-3-phosphate ABC transporter ATP-binding protein [Dehalococcoidia bacterium]